MATLARLTIKRFALVAVVLAIIWWLFADTYAHYRGGASDDRTIRFAHFGTAEDFTLWREVIEEFERAHPDRHVRQEYIVGLAGLYNTKMRQQILSGTLPDVALVQLGPFHELAPHFADLTELVEATESSSPPVVGALDPAALDAFTHDDLQRGLPVSGGNLLIYCNPDCFELAARHRGRQVPLPAEDWTIDDFQRTARLLTCDFDGDGAIDQFGYWHTRWIYYLPFIWSFGANLTDPTLTEWTLTGPEAEQAFTFYRNMIVSDRFCPREDEVPQLFQDVGFLTGKVAMCINGPWLEPFLSKTRLADSCVVAHIPRGPRGRATRITYDGIVMRDDLPIKRRNAALSFIRFVLAKPVQDRIAQTGKALPARVDSLERFSSAGNTDRRRRFVEALSYSRTQPLLPHFGLIDRAMNDHISRFLDPRTLPDVRSFLRGLSQDPAIAEHFAVPEVPAQ